MRAGVAALFVCACTAGVFAAAIVASGFPVTALTTSSSAGTTTTAATATATTVTTVTTVTTTISPTTTATTPKPRAKPRRKAKPQPVRVARGVTVAGIRVGRMTRVQAEARVRVRVARALPLRAGNLRIAVGPASLGFRPYVRGAVSRALRAPAGTRVKLFVVVRAAKVRAYVRALARRFHRDPVDSELYLRGLQPFVSKGDLGRDIRREEAVRAIVFALTHNQRRPVRLPVARKPQAVSRANFGPIIVIRRGSNRLYFYSGMGLVRVFGVATGQSSYPTPLGRYEIVVKWRYPWWYPPDSPWSQGLKPVPPGPGNPLGTRWMGLSAPGVGIHGTPSSGSIGYSVSHGCIRMHIPEAEWLFDRVEIGTPVFIVPA